MKAIKKESGWKRNKLISNNWVKKILVKIITKINEVLLRSVWTKGLKKIIKKRSKPTDPSSIKIVKGTEGIERFLNSSISALTDGWKTMSLFWIVGFRLWILSIL